MQYMAGIFISFEGPDGSGKTTISHIIKEELEKQNYQVLLTREPGGTSIAEQIRDIILNPINTAMDARTETLLYAASRRQHIVEKIIPALRQGYIVISDRFVDSSLVYQGVARNLGIKEVYRLNTFAIDDYMPHKTIFFDIPFEVGLQRIQESKREVDRLEQESLTFHKQVYEGYLKVSSMYPERITKIDANKDITSVKEQVMQEIKKCL